MKKRSTTAAMAAAHFLRFEIRFAFCPIGKQTLKWVLREWKLIISVIFFLRCSVCFFSYWASQPASQYRCRVSTKYLCIQLTIENRSNIPLDKMELRDARQLISIRLIFNAFFKFNKTCFDFHLFHFVLVCVSFCWLPAAAAYLFLISTNETKKKAQHR